MFMVRYCGRSLGLLGKARFSVTRRLSIQASPYFQVPVLIVVRPIIILQSIFLDNGRASYGKSSGQSC